MTDKSELNERGIEAAHVLLSSYPRKTVAEAIAAYLAIAPQTPVSAVVEALKDIASQKTYAEMPADVRDDLDFVGGYEMCVNLARSALASPPPPAQADDWKDAEIARLKAELDEKTGCSITVGGGLSVYGSIEAVGRVQDYILLDSTHPIEKEDVRRSLVRALQKAEALIRELVAALSEYADSANWGSNAKFDPEGMNFEGWDIAREALKEAGYLAPLHP